MKKIIILTLALILALVLNMTYASASPEDLEGQIFPDFSVQTIDGSTFTLSESLKTHDLVLINFWATWCGPCCMEFPALEAAWEQYADRVDVIALSIEGADTVDVLKNFANEYGLQFPIGRDEAKMFDKIEGMYIPTTLIVNRDRCVVSVDIGAKASAEEFTTLFDSLLNSSPDRNVAEANNEWLGKWYLYSFQDLTLYPNTVFFAGDETEYIEIYTEGSGLVAAFNNEGGYLEQTVRNCVIDGNTMHCMGTYTLENKQLIRKMEYDGKVEAIYVYTHEKPKNRFADFDRSYLPLESVNDIDGTWTISQFGMNRAYADASDMSMSGTAVFDNGKLTMSWSRDGVEKNSVIEFGRELDKGRLYTVVNEKATYTVTRLSENTLLLNIGLNSVQWVFTKPGT